MTTDMLVKVIFAAVRFSWVREMCFRALPYEGGLRSEGSCFQSKGLRSKGLRSKGLRSKGLIIKLTTDLTEKRARILFGARAGLVSVQMKFSTERSVADLTDMALG